MRIDQCLRDFCHIEPVHRSSHRDLVRDFLDGVAVP
jgi:hypothetical protein